MPSSRSFYACKTRSISTKQPRIRPFAFYGKTNRSSWGHIQNDCEKCDGGKFWPLASNCSHVFVPVDENHTDCRADVLVDGLPEHTGDVQLQAEQILHTASHQHSPGWGKVALVALSLAQIILSLYLGHLLSPPGTATQFFFIQFIIIDPQNLKVYLWFLILWQDMLMNINLVGYN